MGSLKGKSSDGGETWEPDASDGPWVTKLEPLINTFVAKHHPWVFDEVNPRSVARTFFEATHDDFYLRTRGYWNPICLIFGVLDEKGDAVLTAQELVALAGAQGPMVSFPKLIAFDPHNAQRKGSLHEGITARDVVRAILDPNYGGPCLAFLPDMWKLVVELSSMPSDTVLRDVLALRPLYDLLDPMEVDQVISNGGHHGAESLMNKIKRVCKPQQRMHDKTVTRNVAAVSRHPDKLYRFTEAQDLQASYALGHNNASRRVEKSEAPEVDETGAGLGFSAEDGSGEHWGAHGSWNEEKYAMPPKKAKKAAKAANEKESGEDLEDEYVFSSEEDEDEDEGTEEDTTAVVVGERAGTTMLAQLQVNQIVKALYGPQYPGWWYAQTVSLPDKGAIGPGSQSVGLRWLDEVGGEGSGIYGYDAKWDKPQMRAASKIVDANPEMHEVTEEGGPMRWLTAEAYAAHSASAASSSAVASTAPSESGPAVATSTNPTSATATRPSWSELLATGSSSNPIEIDLEDVVLRTTKLKKLRVGSSALLSMDPTEWLNDCQIGNLLALMRLSEKHQVQFLYPRPGDNAIAVFAGRKMRKILVGESPLAALSQDFVSDAHWRTLKIVAGERKCYYFEPYGSKLRANSGILKAFNEGLGVLNDGWRFESIQLKLQTDGSSCGVWSETSTLNRTHPSICSLLILNPHRCSLTPLPGLLLLTVLLLTTSTLMSLAMARLGPSLPAG